MAANAPYYVDMPQPSSHPFVSGGAHTKYTQPEDGHHNAEPTAEVYADTQGVLEQEVTHPLAELLEAASEGLRDGTILSEAMWREGLERQTIPTLQGRGKRKREASFSERDRDAEGRDRPLGHGVRVERTKRARKGPTNTTLVQNPALETMSKQIPLQLTTRIGTSKEDMSSSATADPTTSATYPPFPANAPSHESDPYPLRHSPRPHVSRTLSHEAEPASVNPATALFRRPPINPPKKSTRPPMSKLFVSLQLTPENFLQLQAQAKSYMLDPAHPERQACVGNRGKGDTDMVKLRLFRCVNDFLVHGAGEMFFGVGAEGREVGQVDRKAASGGKGKEIGKVVGAETKWIWPRDGNTIVGLVTPLLRRMVTNERQRVYAIETRKGGKKKEGVEGENEEAQSGGLGGFDTVYEQHPPHLDPSLPPPVSLHTDTFHHPQMQPLHHVSSLINKHHSVNAEDLRVISIHFSSSDSKPLRPGLDLTAPTAELWEIRYAELCDIIERTLADIVITQGTQGSKPHGDTNENHNDGRDERTFEHRGNPDPDPALLRGLARAAAGLDTDADVDADLEKGGVRLDGAASTGVDPVGAGKEGPKPQNLKLEVLLPTGLSSVRSEEEWEYAKREVGRTFWFQGRCTVVVAVEISGEG